MRTTAFYDKLSELNDALYHGVKNFKDWKLLDTYADLSGVFVALYDIGNGETLFAVKGSDSILDLFKDAALWMRKTNAQADSASKYYESIRDKYKNIIFTGYSLGGSVAQLLGVKYGNETIAFEPYGTGKASGNIINFGNFWDIIFMQNPNEMPGETYLIPMPMPKSGKRDLTTHLPNKHGKPSTAKKVTGKLETNIDYFNRISSKKVNDSSAKIKSYVKDGIIPSVRQRIEALKK